MIDRVMIELYHFVVHFSALGIIIDVHSFWFFIHLYPLSSTVIANTAPAVCGNHILCSPHLLFITFDIKNTVGINKNKDKDVGRGG